MICDLIRVWITQVYILAKTHWILWLKSMQTTRCGHYNFCLAYCNNLNCFLWLQTWSLSNLFSTKKPEVRSLITNLKTKLFPTTCLYFYIFKLFFSHNLPISSQYSFPLHYNMCLICVLKIKNCLKCLPAFSMMLSPVSLLV